MEFNLNPHFIELTNGTPTATKWGINANFRT